MEGRGRMESGGKNEGPTTTKGERRKWIGGREGEGREEEGICRTNVSVSYAPEVQPTRVSADILWCDVMF